MKDVKVTLNNKGIVAVVSLILVLTLSVGVMIGFKAKEHGYSATKQERYLTVEQAEIIQRLQQEEDRIGSGAKVYGTYDERDGHFYVCWDYTDTHYLAERNELAVR